MKDLHHSESLQGLNLALRQLNGDFFRGGSGGGRGRLRHRWRLSDCLREGGVAGAAALLLSLLPAHGDAQVGQLVHRSFSFWCSWRGRFLPQVNYLCSLFLGVGGGCIFCHQDISWLFLRFW